MGRKRALPKEHFMYKDKGTGCTRNEIRCGHCNRLLAKGTAHELSIKCPRCGCINHVRDAIPKLEHPIAVPPSF